MAILEVRVGDYSSEGIHSLGGFGDNPAEVAAHFLRRELEPICWAEVLIEVSGMGNDLKAEVIQCPDLVRKFVDQAISARIRGR